MEQRENQNFTVTEETAWCPGCGNFPLRSALQDALNRLKIKPEGVTMFTGIGQAAKMPHYISLNGFNGLHGRSLPPAVGTKIANKDMHVIVESGDGCTYGEGGNHILHNIRRNVDLVHLVHNNQIYGLTKGQASPTTGEENITGVQPYGINAEPFHPVRFAVGMKASFVARGFVGEGDHLSDLIEQAFDHRGYALVDILQPCVSFNKVNTYQWYSERVYRLSEDYPADNHEKAQQKAREWGNEIPIGVIYREEKEIFYDNFFFLGDVPLVEQERNPEDIKPFLAEFK